jgi:hypothetical protein
MRTVLAIVLVVCCMVASIRIDGVWPPESVRQHVEQVVQRVTEPGKALWSILAGRESTDRERLPARSGSQPMIRSVVGGHRATGQSNAECS